MLASGSVDRVTGARGQAQVSPPAERQPHGEPGASLRRMAGLDRPADALDQAVHDRQPQPGSDAANPAVPLVQRRSVERDRQIVVGQARAAVADLHHDVGRRRPVVPRGRAKTIGDPDGVTRKAFSSSPSSTCRSRAASVQAMSGPAGRSTTNRTPSAAHRRDHTVGRRVDDAADVDYREVDAELLRIQPGEIQQVSDEAGRADATR